MATPKKTNKTAQKEASASKKSSSEKTDKKPATAAKAPAEKAAKKVSKASVKPAVQAKSASKPAASAKVPSKASSRKQEKAPVPAAVKKAPEGVCVPADVQKIIDARKKDQKWLKFVEMQRQHLLDLRDNILDSMAGVTRETLRNHPEGSEASGSGEHQADAGSDAYDRDFALNMLSKEQNALFEVEDALRRIDNGTYGICEISHKAIPILRLEAIPFARLTVECQAQWEKEKGLAAKFVSRSDFGFGGIQNEGDSSVSLDEDEE